MAYWFGVKPWELDDLTPREAEEMVGRLRNLPPIGRVMIVEMRK